MLYYLKGSSVLTVVSGLGGEQRLCSLLMVSPLPLNLVVVLLDSSMVAMV